ncbi:hypothetical protein [Cellulosimicrobium arenosum]|uniref:Uncharacterized protein n=1 Tax=Cellulosimicrobium arenosum TaxID=2708133 RepID=A0A927IZL0_9MICO|nr:hypothetical protein [Cellulosimicrobium arenosum]MBD8078472.1 hypothetical protein [Cellulosimicrobium arenosum]
MTTPTASPPDPTPDGRGETSRRTWPWVVLTIAAVLVVALVVWLVNRPGDAEPASPTSGTATSGTATEEPTETASPSGEPTDEETTSEPAAEGCAATGDGVPDGAGSHEIVDVDGDGQADTAWITPGADRAFGITTASGATFSTPIDSASPQVASAVVNVVAAGDGTAPVALVDTGREVLLLSAAGCALTPTQNEQGDPYTFDKGFTGFGTGVGCTEVSGELRLAGLNAVPGDDGDTFTVSRTFVDLDTDAQTATNGDEETVAEGAAADDAVVTTAQETSCGDLTAGKDGPQEPQS